MSQEFRTSLVNDIKGCGERTERVIMWETVVWDNKYPYIEFCRWVGCTKLPQRGNCNSTWTYGSKRFKVKYEYFEIQRSWPRFPKSLYPALRKEYSKRCRISIISVLCLRYGKLFLERNVRVANTVLLCYKQEIHLQDRDP